MTSNSFSLDKEEKILDQQKLPLNQQLAAITQKEQELNYKKVLDETTYKGYFTNIDQLP